MTLSESQVVLSGNGTKGAHARHRVVTLADAEKAVGKPKKSLTTGLNTGCPFPGLGPWIRIQEIPKLIHTTTVPTPKPRTGALNGARRFGEVPSILGLDFVLQAILSPSVLRGLQRRPGWS